MDDDFLKELRETDRDNEWRSKLLIRGMKQTLEKRKRQSKLSKWLHGRKHKHKGYDYFK
ncbi:hypothetical protein [Paenibacillus sp. CAA11]|uniref:hypothetical protein n=1 Tax=Paenibacillus sp. CAA11 TaxID=1532905 RepID=UPI00131EF236|nr:hypothetical protein [Paenibacillus sp. CAA11]